MFDNVMVQSVILDNLENVILDDFEPYPMESGDYFSEVFTILSQRIQNFDDYMFLVKTSMNSDVPDNDLSWMGKKTVLIWNGGEFNFHDEAKVKGKYHRIFAQHHWDTDTITSIPLGYYAKQQKKLVPMEERLYNISFIGCLNRNRMQLASLVSRIPKLMLVLLGWRKQNGKYRRNFAPVISFVNHLCEWMYPRDIYKFTGDFAQGFAPETYLNLMHTTKISLCPRGWHNVESFRIYESMRAGCVVITEKLPDRSYYKDIPVIQVDDWKEGLDVAKDLLKDTDKLTSLGAACRQFYESKLSPEATAKIIIDRLEN